MVIVLQHTDTLAFADSEGHWVPEHAYAFEFHTTYEVLLFCARHGLSRVQLRFEFPNRELNFTVRVPARSTGGSRTQTSRPPGDRGPGPAA